MLRLRPPAPQTTTAIAAAVIWFSVALLGLIWMWGGPDHTAFGSPDETLTARASQLVATTGSPVAVAPIEDPEGLFRNRLWASTDAGAVPTHPTFLPFALGAAERFIPGGEWMVFVLPALGLAAAGALGVLVMRRRYAVGLLLPLVAFPYLYRFTHPWENMAHYSALLAIAGLFALLWYRTRRTAWLYAGASTVLLAAAIRPDQIHVIAGVAWLLALLGARSGEWATATTAYLSVGVVVVALVLVGNVFVTGDAFTHPFYLLEGPEGTEVAGKNLPPPFSNIVSLILPKGLPELSLVSFQAGKYFWNMGPIRWLTIAVGVSLVAVLATSLRARRYRETAIGIGLVLLLVLLFLSRINSTDWGAADVTASISHSLPRYIALVWLAATVLVLGVVGSLQSRLAGRLAAGAIVALAVTGAIYIYDGERASIATTGELVSLYEEYADAVDQSTLDNAVLYTRFTDKFVWSVRPVAVLPSDVNDPTGQILFDDLAASLDRVMEAGRQPYLFEVTAEEVDTLRSYGFDVQPVPITDDPDLHTFLIRWTMYAVNRA